MSEADSGAANFGSAIWRAAVGMAAGLVLAAVLGVLLAAGPAGPVAAAGQDGFARARADIVRFCSGEQRCIAEQRAQLGYFVTMMAGFDDPGRATARRCMAGARRDALVDWVVAAACLRAAVAGRGLGGRGAGGRGAGATIAG